jgi:hypothetical protein
MATVTPNFNWPVPTSTDLVKDGATAIEALGDSIDASLVDLKGGTSGQVLSKNSNTDMDFVWVTSDDANAIQNTIVDAKGDLITATAADTPARLAVGNNGETLVADSSTSTGLRYQAPKTQNAIYNSSFDIAQRGTSFTTAGGVAYTLDRWSSWATGAGSSMVTTQEAGTGTSRYSAKIRRSTGNTNTSSLSFFQSLETTDSYRFQGQTVTLSFYAKAGANFSAASSILGTGISTGTGTDQIYYNYTGVFNNDKSHTLTTSWQRFTQTVTLAANATEVTVNFYYTPVGTAGADDSYFVTGIQLEVGSQATPYNRMSGTIQGELAACQRYYYRIATTTNNVMLGAGHAYQTNEAQVVLNLPVVMRTAPSVTPSGGTIFTMWSGGTGFYSTASGTYAVGNQCVELTITTSGMTLGRGLSGMLDGGRVANCYLEMSSEL